MMCVYCKGDDAERIDGVALCASCAGRFVEASEPTHATFPFCLRPELCAANGGRCPRDPVCGN
jgi:hypothetical protein